MQNTKNITKIIIDYKTFYSAGSRLTITNSSISYKDKHNKDDNDDITYDWGYETNSKNFRIAFIKITETVRKYLEPTPEISGSNQYNILVEYDDGEKDNQKHSKHDDMFEDLFCEIHKLIPMVEDIPSEFDTEETAKNRIEDLAGDMEHKVPYEETERYDID